MFGFRLAGVVKIQTNQLVLGFMSNYSLVAYYDLALKITNVFSTIFNNYSAVFFPHIAKSKNKVLGKKALILSLILSSIIYLMMAIVLKPLIIFWNSEFLPTVKLFWIIGLFIPLYAIASFLGNSILVAHGYQKQHFISTLWTTFLYILIIYILIINQYITIYSLGLTIFFVQFFSTSHKYYFSKKYNLL